MSKFLDEKIAKITPYVPGEQPKQRKYIKLNTNESPYPPTKMGVQMASEEANNCYLYSDPECSELTSLVADSLGVKSSQVILTNGSDEVLNFAFMAYCDNDTPAVFADITYGFYKVFAKLYDLPTKVIPLKDDFSIDIDKFISIFGTIFIANPNAPTGIALDLNEIERIVSSNPDRIVVVDEAYVDFGAKSAVSLIDKYDNLLVTQTFSKSRSLAGARLGFGVANENLIKDLMTIKYSTNPYNVNRMTLGLGKVAILDKEYFNENCKKVIQDREYTVEKLKELGFSLTNSKANFVFAKSDRIDGTSLYLKLKEKGVLVRHFNDPRIIDYNRITIGNREQMQAFIQVVKEILEETK